MEDPRERRAQDLAALAAVDSLYLPFPDFAGWGRLADIQRDLWERFSDDLVQRKQGTTVEQLQRSIAVAVRAAAIDTGAIEGLYQVDRGFTMSVALQSFAWEYYLGERGEGVRELFAAQLAGYELAIDAVTGGAPLSEAWLRSLHEQICAPQATYRVLTDMGWQEQPLPKGRYKQFPNHVRLEDGTHHAYAPVAAVAPEMHRLFEQLRTAAFEQAHPVEQSAYVHYALAHVHPFADGNGRVARALASVFLYRSLSIPLVIYANQRPSYFAALARADAGDPGPWLAFVADRGIDTMQLLERTLRAAAGPRPDEIAERRASRSSPAETRRRDNLALRLLREIQARWQQAIDEAVRPAQGTGAVQETGSEHHRTPSGYRHAAGPALVLGVATSSAGSGHAAVTVRVNLASDDANPFRFQVEALASPDSLEIREEDVTPELSPSLQLRLDQWIEQRLAALFVDLRQRRRREISGHGRR